MTAVNHSELSQQEERTIPIPGIGDRKVIATRHHWIALEECLANGWTIERIAELAWQDAQQQGLEFGLVLQGLIAYIQADARATLGVTEDAESSVPQLPTSYAGRNG